MHVNKFVIKNIFKIFLNKNKNKLNFLKNPLVDSCLGAGSQWPQESTRE